jgi:hypothetical protein
LSPAFGKKAAQKGHGTNYFYCGLHDALFEP